MASADWSSLPADLLNRIAECFLPTSDLDYYMDFRAVCQSWRSATEDPKNSSDPLFRPRQWVMIRDVYGSATRLLVNTTTGRFLRRKLPLLRKYYVITATSDGLLLLMNRYSPHAVSVLNPFTGYFVRFIAPPPVQIVESATLVSGSSPNLILVCKMYMYEYDEEEKDDDFVSHESFHKVYVADPDGESFAVYNDKDSYPLIRLAIRGIYTNGELGSVAPFPFAVAEKVFDVMRGFIAHPADMSDDQYTMMSEEARYDNRLFLVASAGEMLIIVKLHKGIEIYMMDTERYTVEHVDNIGNRAIFLGDYCRCLSVNADTFPSIEANCIYYMKGLYLPDHIYIYDVRHRREERMCRGPHSYCSRPYTIIQHLCHSLKVV